MSGWGDRERAPRRPRRRGGRGGRRPPSALLWALAALPLAGLWPRAAAAQEVGLGVALGASYSPTAFKHGALSRRAGDSLAGGFFVDVPLSQHLLFSPGATLWGADLGEGKKPATDLDFVVKLRLPLSSFRLGGGVGAGISHLEGSLAGHLTAVASGGVSLSAGSEAFVMMAYKHVVRSAQNLENLHGLAGVIFYF